MDVFKALGNDNPNVAELTKWYGVENGEARVLTKKQANIRTPELRAAFPNRGLTFINATAVRRVAQRSNTPAARFYQWVDRTQASLLKRHSASVQ
ncbi:Bro-N domain-containing protein [Azospirillum thermophilum]|nr:Bro-N domain-containing protein [Azospirillum thermophilum]